MRISVKSPKRATNWFLSTTIYSKQATTRNCRCQISKRRYGHCRNRLWKGKSMREVDSRTLTRLYRCRRLSAVSVGRGTLKPDSFRDRNSVYFRATKSIQRSLPLLEWPFYVSFRVFQGDRPGWDGDLSTSACLRIGPAGDDTRTHAVFSRIR